MRSVALRLLERERGLFAGAMVIAVACAALGGSLHQDVPAHRSDDYDQHAHEVRLEPGSGLARLYGETGPRRVVSIHRASACGRRRRRRRAS